MTQVLVAIDTSVLVAWTVAKHPFHARATPWFDAIYRGEFDAMVCAHALAEPLTLGAYRAAVDRCAERSLRSGSIFDALHLVAAELKGAAALVTFNRDDFARLSAGDTVRVVVPPDPPSVDFTVLP